MDERYVAVLDVAGSRLFCSDQHRDEWSGRFIFAETFRAVHEAAEVADRHGGRVMPWAEVHQLEATAT